MMGILFARESSADTAGDEVAAGAEEALVQAGNTSEEDSGADEALRTAGELLPSAVGLSFLVECGATLECRAVAGAYEIENAKGNRTWRRVPLPTPPATPSFTLTRENPAVRGIFGGRADLVSIWRRLGENELVTVTLINTQRGQSFDVAKALFQVELSCSLQVGTFLPYPAPPHAHSTARAEEDYLYRSAVPYARGHGVAATWKREGDEVREVEIAFLPTVDVPLATFALPPDTRLESSVFSLERLSRIEESPTEVIEALKSFVSAYSGWIHVETEQARAAGEVQAVALSGKVGKWARRMADGVSLLERDPTARRAFSWANRAMGMQMVLSEYLRKLSDEGRQIAPSDPSMSPALDNIGGLSWRPFQLGFFLGVLSSLWQHNSDERLEVDIIWFPTGGGKTEAYLLVSAFELIRRRLATGDDTGTAILSRYTLRMLTAQQFQRTAALFAALEILRRAKGPALGSRRFTLGLWVGDLTPNRYAVALEQFEALVERGGKGKNPFLLERCPRCGTSLFHPKAPPTTGWGVQATTASFKMRCPRGECEFHEELPLNLVDEALYSEPPSMLIGTIDKFANLPWDERGSVFFGPSTGPSMPPTLLIQDELHLISGPLGTLDAMYEAAIAEIIRARGGPPPKIIGSTATIRNAAEQVQALYGRPSNVFPSPISRWDDAFFFRSDPSRTRRYVGVMGQGYVKPVIALIWSAAAVLQSVLEVELTEKELDTYWTLLAYHNSRRELGRTMTAARDEIPTRALVLASAHHRARQVSRVMELSAHGAGIDEAIRQLEASRGSPTGALDIVPCTNILSVGIDINRLGLMLVNGQPKSVAEYIQATSRIGRGPVGGLVMALFSPMKPRDRSHYEDFRAFHENFYRYVEPSSVTPLAPPSRRRTLHAAVVAIIRHTTEWRANGDAGRANLRDGRLHASIARLLDHIRRMDPREVVGAREAHGEIDEFLQEWEGRQGPALLYDAGTAGPQFASLLRPFGAPGGTGRPTMRSMRHVDSEVELRVLQARVQ
jgi:hypothetical protein